MVAPCSCSIDITYFTTLIILICFSFSVFLHFLLSSLQNTSSPEVSGYPWLPGQMEVTVAGSSWKLCMCGWDMLTGGVTTNEVGTVSQLVYQDPPNVILHASSLNWLVS